MAYKNNGDQFVIMSFNVFDPLNIKFRKSLAGGDFVHTLEVSEDRSLIVFMYTNYWFAPLNNHLVALDGDGNLQYNFNNVESMNVHFRPQKASIKFVNPLNFVFICGVTSNFGTEYHSYLLLHLTTGYVEDAAFQWEHNLGNSGCGEAIIIDPNTFMSIRIIPDTVDPLVNEYT